MCSSSPSTLWWNCPFVNTSDDARPAIDGEMRCPGPGRRLGGFDQRRVGLGLQVVPGIDGPFTWRASLWARGMNCVTSSRPPRLTARGRVGGCTTRDRAASRAGSPASATSRCEDAGSDSFSPGRLHAETSHPGSWSALIVHATPHHVTRVTIEPMPSSPGRGNRERPAITSSRGSHPFDVPRTAPGKDHPEPPPDICTQRYGTRTRTFRRGGGLPRSFT